MRAITNTFIEIFDLYTFIDKARQIKKIGDAMKESILHKYFLSDVSVDLLAKDLRNGLK
ncbi:MAG: hypothetical protein P1U56_06030 [Saprospiraceae bacterium]|nr:hypothetical protein [Saprospiraceae bacterium]